MEVHERLRQLMSERGWTEYKLSKKCGLSESTLANIFKRNTMPSITTLESICTAFGITLSQFFSDGDLVELSPDLQELFNNWVTLTAEQKQAILQLISVMNSSGDEKDEICIDI
ncbi:MAG: helix-turn-helix domain-containing protein [Oscillospiraceae bacterium]